MKINLEKFNKELDSISDRIEKVVAETYENINKDINNIPSFKLDEFNMSELKLQKDAKGIYIFYIQRSAFGNFEGKWKEGSLIVPKASPTTIEKHIKYHQENSVLEEWIPLYIGKSKNLLYRIPQHINLKENQTTSSMKLIARKRFENEWFSLKIISLETEHYGFIAHYVESVLRDKVKPIVGKK